MSPYTSSGRAIRLPLRRRPAAQGEPQKVREQHHRGSRCRCAYQKPNVPLEPLLGKESGKARERIKRIKKEGRAVVQGLVVQGLVVQGVVIGRLRWSGFCRPVVDEAGRHFETPFPNRVVWRRGTNKWGMDNNGMLTRVSGC